MAVLAKMDSRSRLGMRMQMPDWMETEQDSRLWKEEKKERLQ
ncbi:hypothetical protein FOCG_09019 [Fusarium oxysporum f. sp. radicis-lycopersici 26381]|uniref:Uncharacterized protein n=1 Tax=Fusarium oxysporum Fo47 TaxID=660027 RepID=W9K4Q5_FUSOX|nr:hypothetical protein FOZG_08426 [Fusarium oxysporum Fo47]EWZ83759.1 hypothetical protein FOWG_12685 [Fusarium oxysporum f. sp. lycopersici MN25]EXL50840.1 hypothetical protein FOCG_09019 [Fusarium oxysporum f. sp. radicis-lycopersici 26381]